MPYQRLAAAVLAGWRAVEARLVTIDPQSAEAAELKIESHRLRTDYQRLIADAIEHHRPEPPPFPDKPG